MHADRDHCTFGRERRDQERKIEVVGCWLVTFKSIGFGVALSTPIGLRALVKSRLHVWASRIGRKETYFSRLNDDHPRNVSSNIIFILGVPAE